MQQGLIILGIGSPFGADRLGWEVVERLKQQQGSSAMLQKVTMQACDHPGMALAHYLHEFPRAILIDAMVSDQSPGTIIRLDGHTLEPGNTPLSTHAHGLAAALQLGATLGWLPSQVTVMGMVVAPDSDELPVSEQLEPLTQAVLAEAERMLQT